PGLVVPKPRWQTAAGTVALLAAACLVSSPFQRYDRDNSVTLAYFRDVLSYSVLFAVLAAACGVALLIARPPATFALGALVGVVSAASLGSVSTLLYMLGRPSISYYLPGEWLQFAGHALLTAAAVVAWRARP